MLSKRVHRGSRAGRKEEGSGGWGFFFLSSFEKTCLSFNKFIHILASCKTGVRAKSLLPKFTLQTGSLRSDNQLKCSTQSPPFGGEQRRRCSGDTFSSSTRLELWNSKPELLGSTGIRVKGTAVSNANPLWPPLFTPHHPPPQEYLDPPAKGQKSKLSVTMTDDSETEQLSQGHTLPYMRPIPFLEYVLFLKNQNICYVIAQNDKHGLSTGLRREGHSGKARWEITFHSHQRRWLLFYKRCAFVEIAWVMLI